MHFTITVGNDLYSWTTAYQRPYNGALTTHDGRAEHVGDVVRQRHVVLHSSSSWPSSRPAALEPFLVQ